MLRVRSSLSRCTRHIFSRSHPAYVPPLTRAASSTFTPSSYPFPKVERPSPHQIFHLPQGASAEDVKNRCTCRSSIYFPTPAQKKKTDYELVRLYHPDAPYARERESDATTRHARFRAITTAYEKLKADYWRSAGTLDGDLTDEEAQRERQRWQRPRPASYNSRSAFDERRSVDERWKDRMILGGLGATLLVVVAQYVTVRRGTAEQILDSRHKTLTSWQEQRRKQQKQDS